MKVAIIGANINGQVVAHVLAKGGAEVVLYDHEDYFGRQSKIYTINDIDLDLDLTWFNRVTHPNTANFFENIGVDMKTSYMSYSMSLDDGHQLEWGNQNNFSSLFAQKKNAIHPYFWKMLREIVKFNDDLLRYLEEEHEQNEEIDLRIHETLGNFIESRGYSDLFQKSYLIPICASIWSCPSDEVKHLTAYSVLSYFRNHDHLLQLFGCTQRLTVNQHSQNYVTKVKEELQRLGCQIRSQCEIQSISTTDDGCIITCEDGSQELYSGCIVAAHAPDALKMLGEQATYDERRILGAFQYVYSEFFLHRDEILMPRNPSAWSAWNFLGTIDGRFCVTYWLNVLQIIEEKGLPYLVTVNPFYTPQPVLLKWTTGHPVPSVAASKASRELYHIQGKRGIWFCGAYQGNGSYEDGLKAGLIAAHSMLNKKYAVLENPKHMVPSFLETGARLFVTRFLRHHVSTGCLILLEEGGTMFTFEGSKKKCPLKVTLRIHSPQFYWKVATQADLGLADAYINGDFSLVDKDEGLQNLFMIFIAIRDLKTSTSSSTKRTKRRGWWTPLFFTASISSAKYFLEHVSRRNTLTQARRNISRHYDLSNQLFALFLDETMTYSCAIFKAADEDLKTAQLRKISLLIKKAKINKTHEILEIGSGWGSLAIEVVKQTGCKYTGITLSVEQLTYAEMKVKEAGLQDRIRFLLCDYRQMASTNKFDRIISCEMIEAVGHEYMDEFFDSCESLLAEDGLLVLQFTSISDERYDGYRHSSDFIKEYIFPGCCVPSLGRVISAMVTSSRMCIEQCENIGIHFYQTLRYWKKNFLEHQSDIIRLGFDDKFIRTWEYYFDYCAAGFKTCTLGNYQVACLSFFTQSCDSCQSDFAG
ncbi:uncharacterized protein LOC124912860 [Impatiens glandulifera]|uniref:uncharacterized protein LOC124912860 n=1 Tax=Impatiens glandulifera TaxID=253017 RepID=UPI001FB0729C|nr:uncharacterized protein LOC124912860 [Impatiens glandulifera]